VVPFSELKEEVRRWADDMLDKSPTALRALKGSFNADSDSIAGIGALSHINLESFVKTDEAKEGVNAFNEKRPPDFSRFR
jgi:2-ketocyclohexanecarboxyl-CoA hydrolase